MSVWFYKDGVLEGSAIPTEELEALIEAKTLSPAAMLWTDAWGEAAPWQRLDATEEFSRLLIPSPPPLEESTATLPETSTPPPEQPQALPPLTPGASTHAAPPTQATPLQASASAPKSQLFDGETLIRAGAGLFFIVLALQLLLMLWFVGLNMMMLLVMGCQMLLAAPLLLGMIRPPFTYAMGAVATIALLAVSGLLGIPSSAANLTSQREDSAKERINKAMHVVEIAELQVEIEELLEEEEDAKEAQEALKKAQELSDKEKRQLATLQAELNEIRVKSVHDPLKVISWRSTNGFLILATFLIFFGAMRQRESA